MITDARRPRPKVIALTPYRVQPYDSGRMKIQAKRYLCSHHTEFSSMTNDSSTPKPKVVMLMPHRIQIYNARRKETQANSTYADAVQNTAI